MSSQLALAAQLSRLDRTQLETVLRARALANPNSIRDALDLAGALLKTESITRALTALSRDALARLLHAPSAEAPSTELACLALQTLSPDDVWETLPEVREQLMVLLAEAGVAPEELLSEAPVPAIRADAHPAAAQSREHSAAEHAFETVRAVNQLLRAIAEEPVAMRTPTTLTVSATKRLAAAIALEPEQTLGYLRLILSSDLVESTERQCCVSAKTGEWATWSRPERFAVLAEGWLEQLKPFVRDLLSGGTEVTLDTARTELLRRYPLATDDVVADFELTLGDGALYGLIVAGELSAIGQQLLSGQRTAARATLEQLFPSSVAHVYVQPDLSVIAPGPLDAAVEEQLLNFAILESAGLASSYRISARTLEAALGAGQTESQIREFLTEHSLTGIPQPLDYLLTEASNRHGGIVVREVFDGSFDVRARSLVWCREPAVAAQLRVDRSLAVLALSAVTDAESWSMVEPGRVVAALREAGYAVTLDAPSEAEPHPHVAHSSADPVTELVDRIVTASQNESAAGSVERLLQLAVRQKQRIRAVLEQPDGTVREFRLRPVGLSNGRLRGIDEQAEVERTLPVSHLIEVEHLADEPR